MATARFTLGSILSAASETATTVANTMSAANTAVGMLNTFVSTASSNQKMRYAMEAVGTKQQIASDLAMEMVSRDQAVKDYCGSDQDKQDSYNTYLAELLAAANA